MQGGSSARLPQCSRYCWAPGWSLRGTNEELMVTALGLEPCWPGAPGGTQVQLVVQLPEQISPGVLC